MLQRNVKEAQQRCYGISISIQAQAYASTKLTQHVYLHFNYKELRSNKVVLKFLILKYIRHWSFDMNTSNLTYLKEAITANHEKNRSNVSVFSGQCRSIVFQNRAVTSNVVLTRNSRPLILTFTAEQGRYFNNKQQQIRVASRRNRSGEQFKIHLKTTADC